MLPPLKGTGYDSGAPARLLDQDPDVEASTEPAYAPTPDPMTPDPTTMPTPDPGSVPPQPAPAEDEEDDEEDDDGDEGRVR